MTVKRVRLFLIRHGETVDNVAQLYAGSRDSELTNHGFHQATRLGIHFKTQGIHITHLFSSHLQRAVKTATIIQQEQASLTSYVNHTHNVPKLVQLPLLMEQDFGSREGKKWSEKPPDSKLIGKKRERGEDKDESSFIDIESKESIAKRADAFLAGHLLPLLDEAAESSHDKVVAIVSHGIMLSHLWKRFLLRLQPESVSFSPELLSNSSRLSLEHLGGWSNTGYLELCLIRSALGSVTGETLPDPNSKSLMVHDTHVTTEGDPSVSNTSSNAYNLASGANEYLASANTDPTPHSTNAERGWTVLIETVNGKDHLKGIRRTGGGVGSARHDSSQKNIDSFFKPLNG
ncbi:histidine phosphatase superfamily [Dendryphion nanum]|uniref:Histidine phosphatase superfamily n=1 Tax=Dendryphion nanum TaxID=256645 RepID=A0A9P9IDT7_9PLEO|nr:histidine phosphatase superfamily [Dendryphion nanum]